MQVPDVPTPSWDRFMIYKLYYVFPLQKNQYMKSAIT